MKFLDKFCVFAKFNSYQLMIIEHRCMPKGPPENLASACHFSMTTSVTLVVYEDFCVTLRTMSLRHDPHALVPMDNCVKIDCTVLTNPWNLKSLRNLSGEHELVLEYVRKDKKFPAFWSSVTAQIDASLAKSSDFIVDFVCFGGKHRSKAISTLVRKYIEDKRLIAQ